MTALTANVVGFLNLPWWQWRCHWLPQVNQQMSGMTLNGTGGQMAFGQPPTAMGSWAATGSGQTLSTQLWKWASVAASRQAQQETRRRAAQTIPCAALRPTVMRLKTGAHPHHGPAFRTWNLYLSLFFSYSLYLSLFLSIVWVNRESSRITAWQFLPIIWFFWIITFIFLFWKKKMKTTLQWQGNNTPFPFQHDKIGINISEKLQDQLHKLLLYHCIIIRL